MENKNLYQVLGAVAVVGLGWWLYNESQKNKSKTTIQDKSNPIAPIPPVLKEDKTPEIVANAIGQPERKGRIVDWGVDGYSNFVTYPIYYVKAKKAVTITNGANETLNISVGQRGTFQLINIGLIPQNDYLAEANFGGNKIRFHYTSSPNNPNSIRDLILKNNEFDIISVVTTRATKTNYSNVDGRNNTVKNIGYGRYLGEGGYEDVQPIVIANWGVDGGAVVDTDNNILFYGSAPKHYGADGFHYPAKASLGGGFYGITGRRKTFKKVYANEALRAIPKRSLEEGKMWCCSERDVNGNCTQWTQRPIGSPCDNNA